MLQFHKGGFHARHKSPPEATATAKVHKSQCRAGASPSQPFQDYLIFLSHLPAAAVLLVSPDYCWQPPARQWGITRKPRQSSLNRGETACLGLRPAHAALHPSFVSRYSSWRPSVHSGFQASRCRSSLEHALSRNLDPATWARSAVLCDAGSVQLVTSRLVAQNSCITRLRARLTEPLSISSWGYTHNSWSSHLYPT